MSRFKVGDPVWNIGPISGLWRAGEIVGPLQMRRFRHSLHGWEIVDRLAYIVDIPGHISANPHFNPLPGREFFFSCEPHTLRPRNPDQHEPAVDFDVRGLTAPRETV